MLANDGIDPSKVLSLTVVWGPEHGTVDTPSPVGPASSTGRPRFIGVESFVNEVCTSERMQSGDGPDLGQLTLRPGYDLNGWLLTLRRPDFTCCGLRISPRWRRMTTGAVWEMD